MKPARETSAGFVIFKADGERRYLLLQHSTDYWNFPKGKVESGETLIRTATRELYEETRLREIEVIEDFEYETKYQFMVMGEPVDKTVTFFLARLNEGQVILSEEHFDCGWFTYDRALMRLKHEAAKDLLRKAEDFLTERKLND